MDAKPPAPSPKGPLRENAYATLRRGILDGTLGPGSALSEVRLANRFQTSRSPIRDALGRLEQEGYVVRKPNGRLIVRPLDTDELDQLYQVRAAVEGLATRLATHRLTGLALDELAEKVKRIGETSRAGDVQASLAEGQRFHDIILANCANAPLVEIVRSLRHQISRYRSLIAGARNQHARTEEHRAILKALERRDPDAAEQAMKEHIRRSAQALLKQASK